MLLHQSLGRSSVSIPKPVSLLQIQAESGEKREREVYEWREVKFIMQCFAVIDVQMYTYLVYISKLFSNFFSKKI